MNRSFRFWGFWGFFSLATLNFVLINFVFLAFAEVDDANYILGCVAMFVSYVGMFCVIDILISNFRELVNGEF